jgi:hypothetical protein
MAEPIRLYLDEDAQRTALVRALRARQVDVLTANQANNTGIPDSAQLAFAASVNRIVFTLNRGDFVKLHVEHLQKGQDHCGIIVSDQLEIGVIIRRLLRLMDGRTAGDMKNWLEFLSNWR